MWSKAFWAAAAERAVRTTAQAMLSLWLVGDVALNALSVDWGEAAGVGLGAALVSLLMSLTASATQPHTGASFGAERPRGYYDQGGRLQSGGSAVNRSGNEAGGRGDAREKVERGASVDPRVE